MNKLVIFLICFFLIYFLATKLYVNIRHKSLRKMAVETFPEFNKENFHYWVDYGTLLGIVREKDIIKHDDDLDICTIESAEQVFPKLKRAIDTLGKQGKKHYLEYHPWGAFRIKADNNPWHMDVYLCQIKNGKIVDPTGEIPVELVGNVKNILWNDIEVPVPEKHEQSLEWRYGNDWRVPKKMKAFQYFFL